MNDHAFDSSGNTTKDANGRTFVYDAENKQIEVKNASNETIGQYWYDGDGRRVKKRGWINGQWETTVFVYDASSRLVAEYSTNLNPTPQVAYLTNDHLGSPRINTNENGNVTSRHDYRPYGEEVTERTHAQYAADTIRKQFTGYERDDETDLDYAQARYFGSSSGRFSTPDPLAASANPVRPQSWNRYSYSYNNPLTFTDPSGMIAGDFYNLDGKKIGADGVNDGKIHIVLDKDEAKEIAKSKEPYTKAVNSKFTLPNAEVVTAIGEAVERSNSATFDKSGLAPLQSDTKTMEVASGGFRETSVSWKTEDGKTVITAAPDGPYSDPRIVRGTATVSTPSDSDGDAHIHPSGEIETRDRNTSSGTTTSIGGTYREPARFVQPPSDVDIANSRGRNRIVVGAGNRTVYFYNSSGTMKQTMKLDNFLKIGR